MHIEKLTKGPSPLSMKNLKQNRKHIFGNVIKYTKRFFYDNIFYRKGEKKWLLYLM